MYLVLLSSEKFSLNGNLYDFLGDYNSVKKSDILNIQKYLMTKTDLLSKCLLYY